MPAIHLIEKLNKCSQVDEHRNEWESRHWVITNTAAAKLIGGDLYLHKKQTDPSFMGGKIVGFRLEDGKVVFRFIQLDDHNNFSTDAEGWGNEQKRVGIK